MGDIKTLKVLDFGQFKKTPTSMVDKVIRKYVLPIANIHCMRFVRKSTGEDLLYCEFGSHQTALAVKEHFERQKKVDPSSILFEWSYINLQEEYMPVRLRDNIEVSYKEPRPDGGLVCGKDGKPVPYEPVTCTWFNEFLPWQN